MQVAVIYKIVAEGFLGWFCDWLETFPICQRLNIFKNMLNTAI